MNANGLIFELVSKAEEHVLALYKLLEKRKNSISHVHMPSYYAHEKFVKNNPYRSWYLVKNTSGYIGSFYITRQNTVGINIFEENTRTVVPDILRFVRNNYKPLASIPSVRGARFAINVPPENIALIKTLEEVGSKMLQVTFTIPEQM